MCLPFKSLLIFQMQFFALPLNYFVLLANLFYSVSMLFVGFFYLLEISSILHVGSNLY